MPPQDALTPKKRLLFLAGAEGSGTTMLLRLLAAPPRCAAIGGNYFKLPDTPSARPLADAFNTANARLWDRRQDLTGEVAAFSECQEALMAIAASDAYAEAEVLVAKRSFPFGGEGDRYSPDLWQVLGMLPKTRVVAIYREPCAATFSALRRGFDTDLSRLARRCAEQLTWLAAQLRAIGPEAARVVSYEALCRHPEAELTRLSAFCDLPLEAMLAAAETEGLSTSTDRRYAEELPQQQHAWLERYFDPRRRQQWDTLTDAALAA